MRASAEAMGCDPERTGMEESGPTTVREQGRPGRGSLIAAKYRLEMLLGEGGMACVWSAYNVELELPVAVKLLRAGIAHERLAERLRHEARAAARLVHPNIVRVFDVAATESGEPFIVMELLTGKTLSAVLARGPLESVVAVELLLPIAQALAFAHAHGIVHRDVKPDNVFLSTEGDDVQPKLLDFGIAKLTGATATSPKLTEKGTLIGSPSYMSPEQVLGEDVDYRTDIWSFCVLLYKAIAGKTPFHGVDKLATLEAIVDAEPPSLASFGVDPALSQLVHAGLAKDPAARPLSLLHLAGELSRWLDAQGTSPEKASAQLRAPSARGASARVASGSREQSTQRIVPVRSRRRSWAPLSVLLVLLVSGGAVWASSSTRSETRSLRSVRPAGPPAVINVPSREPPSRDPSGSALSLNEPPLNEPPLSEPLPSELPMNERQSEAPPEQRANRTMEPAIAQAPLPSRRPRHAAASPSSRLPF